MIGYGNELIGAGERNGFAEERSGLERFRAEMEKQVKEQIRGIVREIGIGEVSEKIGISRQAMYKRLEGNMSIRSLCEICEALGYEIELRKK